MKLLIKLLIELLTWIFTKDPLEWLERKHHFPFIVKHLPLGFNELSALVLVPPIQYRRGLVINTCHLEGRMDLLPQIFICDLFHAGIT